MNTSFICELSDPERRSDLPSTLMINEQQIQIKNIKLFLPITLVDLQLVLSYLHCWTVEDSRKVSFSMCILINLTINMGMCFGNWLTTLAVYIYPASENQFENS